MPIINSTRKVQVFGDSLAVTIPSIFVKINQIKKGYKMRVFFDLEGVLIFTDCTSEEELLKCLKIFIKKIEEK